MSDVDLSVFNSCGSVVHEMCSLLGWARVGIVGGSGWTPPPPLSSCLQTLIFEWKSAINFNPWAKFQTFRQLIPSSFRSIPILGWAHSNRMCVYCWYVVLDMCWLSANKRIHSQRCTEVFSGRPAILNFIEIFAVYMYTLDAWMVWDWDKITFTHGVQCTVHSGKQSIYFVIAVW